ncbi:T9SS type A sorting domain-containing protein [Mesonia sp. MT50]|uniref:T9SS type A sorting domain-containing protein n=1 Tax=Mesonia profundi TaxID=3070998 RepID=A0ABU1A599_9FLAO|nr:ELWxxDGT repeat protein [Mesonia profundi]MDQ7917951.1 T9SS type A sorting domain-containing protein [Mesonia profundi]
MKLKNYLTREKQILNGFSKTGSFLIALLFANCLMAQTPELVSPDAITPKYLTEYNGEVFFTADFQQTGKNWLWSSDGTTTNVLSGTVTPTHPGSQPRDLKVFNNQLIFSALHNEGGNWNRELYEFVGSAPSLIKNIQIGGESGPYSFIELNGSLYFAADNGYNGREPWVTDGTESGTTQIADIYFGSSGSNPFTNGGIVKSNGKILLNAKDDTYGTELWGIDGTTNGTNLIKDIKTGSSSSYPTSFYAVNNKVYFSATDDSHGKEPWVTDGTNAGTYMLKDINTSTIPNSLPGDFTAYNNKVYFKADDGNNGTELWVTDGTEAGTVLLKDINPGSTNSSHSNPRNFIEYNGQLYFGAYDGNSYGLWVTDGTATNTVKIITTSDQLSNTFTYDDRLYFTADDGSNGRQLWVSDGSTSGTQVIAPTIAPNSDPIPNATFEHAVVAGTLYYTADYDGNGIKMYKRTTNNLNVNTPGESDFVVYPNPVQDVLHLETTAHNIQKVELLSITGQHLQTWEGESEINISQFTAGSYFVKITTDNHQSLTKQILKN